MKKNNDLKNPKEYGYEPQANTQIEGVLLLQTIQIINNLLEEETQERFPFLYKYVNKDTDKVVKNPKPQDLQSGKVIKMFDWDKTIFDDDREPRYELTAKGRNLARLKYFLESIHLRDMEEGLSKHFSELNGNPLLQKVSKDDDDE